jgi:hypothetical protein
MIQMEKMMIHYFAIAVHGDCAKKVNWDLVNGITKSSLTSEVLSRIKFSKIDWGF